ncbi:MAG: MBL fold metallo-hydrolase [Planctomycetota bacterium]
MLAGWAVIGAGAWGTAAWAPAGDDGRFRFDAKADALAWTALSVGDGSAHLLRSGDSAALVDCGSGGWPRMGSAALVPALRAMGVRRLDWALVTHGDLDHFVGLLDVLAEVDIGVVFVGADVLEQARASPGGPEAALLAGLEARGVAAEEVVAGWETTLGEARVVCLWPSASPEERAGLAPGNDRSAVLRIEVAGRAVLLAGDVQRDAMEALLDRGASLQADAAAIPHHGGYEQGVSERWVQAVGAEVWVQSSSRRRQRDAVWDPLMRAMGAVRYATARDGAVMVGIDRSGELRVVRYRDDGRPRGRSDADGLAHPGDGL